MLSSDTFTFTVLSCYKIRIHKAQLSYNSYTQSSALIKFTFAVLSSHKIHISKAQLSLFEFAKISSYKIDI